MNGREMGYLGRRSGLLIPGTSMGLGVVQSRNSNGSDGVEDGEWEKSTLKREH